MFQIPKVISNGVMLGEGTLVVEEMKSVEITYGEAISGVCDDECGNIVGSRSILRGMVYRKAVGRGRFSVSFLGGTDGNDDSFPQIKHQSAGRNFSAGGDESGAGATLDIDSEEAIYKRRKNRRFLKLAAAKKDTCRIKEVVSIGGRKENKGNNRWSEVTGRKLDTRLEQDELKLMGELLLFCFYESPDGKIDWGRADDSL